MFIFLLSEKNLYLHLNLMVKKTESNIDNLPRRFLMEIRNEMKWKKQAEML